MWRISLVRYLIKVLSRVSVSSQHQMNSTSLYSRKRQLKSNLIMPNSRNVLSQLPKIFFVFLLCIFPRCLSLWTLFIWNIILSHLHCHTTETNLLSQGDLIEVVSWLWSSHAIFSPLEVATTASKTMKDHGSLSCFPAFFWRSREFCDYISVNAILGISYQLLLKTVSAKVIFA